MSPSPVKTPRPSQVTLKTVLTVALGGVLVWAGLMFLGRTLLAVTLTVTALMIAVALDHAVAFLVRHRLPRPAAIALVLLAGMGVAATLGLLVIPAAVNQFKTLVSRLPDIIKGVRETHLFHRVDERFHIATRLTALEKEVPHLIEGAASPLLALLGGVLSGMAAVVTVALVTVFMLIFGGNLVHGLLGEALPSRRPMYEGLIAKTYRLIGGYLIGLGLICLCNAACTTVFLAIVGLPFFLPMGILSGLSSIIPYAGPLVICVTVTLLAMATGGVGTGIACAIYFIAYGQVEGQLLSPLIFRRTVHVNPLVVVLAILFFGELAGLIGAVLAVPAAAAIQILVRELLRARREQLHLAATPLNSPDDSATGS